MARKYKLFELIGTFDAPARRKIKKMLRSPFFVYRPKILELFEILIVHLDKKGDFPSLEFLFNRLFPDEPFQALKVRGLMSDLLERLEEWLLINHFRQDPIASRLTLASIYRKQKLEKNFQSSIKKSHQLLDNFPFRNQHFYELNLQFFEENMSHQSASKRTENLYFQEISQNTDINFLIRKLKNACSLLTHQSVVKAEYDFGILDYFIDTLEDSAYLEIPMVALYYYCFRFLKEENNLHYFLQFKETLTTYRAHFSIENLRGPFLLGINFCIKKLNQGNLAFGREGLQLYKEGLQQKILLKNKVINRFTFNNIVGMALKLKEFDWTLHFIDTNASLLKPTYQQATISFNKARLAFARKEFSQALVHLQSAEHKDLVNILIAKSLLVQIYFELEEIRSLESHLDSFSQFIRRREVSDYHRTNFMNIIAYVHKIMATPAYNKKERALLQEKIQAEQFLSIKDWLLEKAQ